MKQITFTQLIVFAVLARVGFFIFGLYQDAYLQVKYTDIDYLVFSDAARYVANGFSPYMRETYRYTPILAWLLVPNSWDGLWYSFGKIVFMLSDIITGAIILSLLNTMFSGKIISQNKILFFSSVWLLNPMAITISTRGSSESVLTVLIMSSAYFLLSKQNYFLSALFMGAAVHLKLYPIIYLASIFIFLSDKGPLFFKVPFVCNVNKYNLLYAIVTLGVTTMLNLIMFQIYGYEFLENAFFYHFKRLDHRHNFSIYNIVLYYVSTIDTQAGCKDVIFPLEKLAFLPQFFISIFAIPIVFAKKDLMSCFFLQTFAFVTFNKVITSQYFIWYIIFIPHVLARLSHAERWRRHRGLLNLLLWVLSQSCWLYFAYQLEFQGKSTFDKGLIYSSFFFFLSNCKILGNLIEDFSSCIFC